MAQKPEIRRLRDQARRAARRAQLAREAAERWPDDAERFRVLAEASAAVEVAANNLIEFIKNNPEA